MDINEHVHWFKSSYSGGSGTECVEVADLVTAIGVRDSQRPADLHATVGIRDSKRPGGRHIAVPRDAWAGFIASVRLQQL
ncbi:DUF397 domain-containing protein [Streptomyces sp. NPDC001832]|uniref:DUF397 domain-containing protein n=1 Tax=Streptomyces sp. NPDC001832 TaxID=3154527 RepID=UPI00332A1F65